MKGIILAGGFGTRLRPLTLITNKHLLPIYDKPMILYPLATLRQAGITEIMIVCGKEHGGDFMNFLGSGQEYGVKLSYALQSGAGGIAEALGLAEDFAGSDKIAVILGDNIFEQNFSSDVASFEKSTDAVKVFVKEVEDPERFGVGEIQDGKLVGIEEKPKAPKSNYAVVGFYMYGPDAFEKIKTLKPSARGELEITDLHNIYIQQGGLSYAIVEGFWSDAGTFETLMKSSLWAAEKPKETT